MLEFKVIELSDKLEIDRCLSYSDFRGCEYCFANNLAWRRMYGTKVCLWKDFYISCSGLDKGKPRFTFPAGRGDVREIFGEMKKVSESFGIPLTVGSVTKEQLPMLRELFGDGSFEVSADEGGWDYIYSRTDLAELAGKKYHAKRNHLKKLPEDCVYSPLSEKDFDDCITYAAAGYSSGNGYDDFSKVCEQFAINTYFENFGELGLWGGVLRQGGEVIAFTIGERINSDTVGVHIEKAEAGIDGAYPAVNNGFAKSVPESFTYINREEDLGIEGLRKAKRSYHPVFLLEKYTVTFG
ncbi:MAG: phosphatidylglycerol lysyltransferase domain-containing protein [Ruminococcus sp.]|nr:phosphatidylglycerol lysyltransferase domain-containing protein [Ruminococcus sp.]